jgi:hypothetical protein
MIDDRPEPPPIRKPGPYREPVRPLTEKDLPPKKSRKPMHYITKGSLSLGGAITLAYALAVAADFLPRERLSSAVVTLTGFLGFVAVMVLALFGLVVFATKGKLQ